MVGCDHLGKDVGTGTRGSSAKEASLENILTCNGERTLTGKTTNLVLGVRKVKDGSRGGKFPSGWRSLIVALMRMATEPPPAWCVGSLVETQRGSPAAQRCVATCLMKTRSGNGCRWRGDHQC